MLTQILLFILFVIWIVAGVYITMASLNLISFNTSTSDPNLRRAYVYTTWAAVIIWLAFFLIVVLGILAVVGLVALFSTGVGEAAVAYQAAGGDIVSSASGSISWITIIAVVIISILLLTTGILSTMALINIEKSSLYQKNKTVTAAYQHCLIAIVLTFGSLFLLIVGVMIYYFLTTQNTNKNNPMGYPSGGQVIYLDVPDYSLTNNLE